MEFFVIALLVLISISLGVMTYCSQHGTERMLILSGVQTILLILLLVLLLINMHSQDVKCTNLSLGKLSEVNFTRSELIACGRTVSY